MRKIILLSVAALAPYALAGDQGLPPLDSRGFNGIKEMSRPELVKLMTTLRSLTAEEERNLDRGCPGLACVYQGLGLKRWPELARGTVAYLTHEDALSRPCPNGQRNFVFVKQGCWVAGSPPVPNPRTRQVSVESITRTRPGFYGFGYAAYFPSTRTYAWMNHSDYGFPVNLLRPQKAYLSSFPPPLDASRPGQIFCSTCR